MHALADLAQERPAGAAPVPAAATPALTGADRSSVPVEAALPVTPAAPRPAPVVDRGDLRTEAVRLAAEGQSQRVIATALGASTSSVARWLAQAPEAVPAGA
ncbi:helix-turn-helix domain-containing protein [Actinotalea sp. JY-7876]|uniref:helix-turn-helix domain-containing protein n=1 Tax=Actinotalea sp. JY-7876 TaxID=2758442 RepID=UPI00351BB733